MSVKSLLQLILLLLIFIIIGGVYFLYFYSGPLKEQVVDYKNFNITEKNTTKDEEILDNNKTVEKINTENIQNEVKKNDKDKNTNIKVNKIENLNKDKKNISDTKLKENEEKINNLTKEIEYVSSNKNGDVYKILAEYGKTNIKNTNILNLENVEGSITSKDRSKIYISSDYANYNYSNQDSKFFRNVVIKYDNKIIECDNLDIIIDNDIAIAYNNVVMTDKDTFIKAEIISFNVITKEININSKDNLKIISN